MKTFPVPGFAVPVLAEPDVCVVGGGAAGVAAAVGAARCGLTVWLVEKYGFCGGATVAGLSGTICGLYSTGDRPRQIVFGFAHEFAAMLHGRGGLGAPIAFGRTVLVPHHPAIWKEVADDLLDSAGIHVRYHTTFLRAYANAFGVIESLLFRGPEGMFALQPACVVDASGDAEIVASCGGETSFGKNGVVQTPTMVFRMGGVDMRSFLQVSADEIDRRVAEANRSGKYALPRHHVYLFPSPAAGEVLCNMTRITYPDGRIPVGISGEDLTYAEIAGRRQAREYARFLGDCVPGFEGAYLVDTGAQVGIRQTRSIVGVDRLANEDVLRGRKRPGAVTLSAWPIELHSTEGTGVTIRYLQDDYYEIPLGALVPRMARNLLAPGRCLSAEHEALASARVTAQCFGMGYAAGAACGLVVREGQATKDLSGPEVRDWMHEHGLKTADQS